MLPYVPAIYRRAARKEMQKIMLVWGRPECERLGHFVGDVY